MRWNLRNLFWIKFQMWRILCFFWWGIWVKLILIDDNICVWSVLEGRKGQQNQSIDLVSIEKEDVWKETRFCVYSITKQFNSYIWKASLYSTMAGPLLWPVRNILKLWFCKLVYTMILKSYMMLNLKHP